MFQKLQASSELDRNPRCLLFVPGVKLDRYGPTVDDQDVDGLIFDLEDSVSLDYKAQARDAIHSFLSTRRPVAANTYIRINGFTTPQFRDDLNLVFDLQPDALMLPKVSNVEEVLEIENAVDEYERRTGKKLPLYLTIETLAGHRNCQAILEKSKKTFMISPGYGDLSLELEIDWPDISAPGPINRILTDVILAGKFAKVPVMDAVSREIAEENMEAMQAETVYGRSVGMIGKVAIHPRQVTIINDVYNQNQLLKDAVRTLEAFSRLEDGSSVLVNAKGRYEGNHGLKRAKKVVEIRERRIRGNQ